MKLKVGIWTNADAGEYLLNLVAQGYFGEAYDFKMKLVCAFDDSLTYIMGNFLNNELKKMKKTK